jgi:hypothetical protein
MITSIFLIAYIIIGMFISLIAMMAIYARRDFDGGKLIGFFAYTFVYVCSVLIWPILLAGWIAKKI